MVGKSMFLPGEDSRTRARQDARSKKPKKVAMVAIANRMARQCWAVASKGQDWRRMPVTAA